MNYICKHFYFKSCSGLGALLIYSIFMNHAVTHQ